MKLILIYTLIFFKILCSVEAIYVDCEDDVREGFMKFKKKF